MLPLAWIMVFLHLVVSLLFIYNSKMDITRIRGTQKTIASTGVDLQQARTSQSTPKLHIAGWKYMVHLDTPTMIGRTIMVGCNTNQVLCWSPFWALFWGHRWLNLEVSWEPGWGLRLKPPFEQTKNNSLLASRCHTEGLKHYFLVFLAKVSEVNPSKMSPFTTCTIPIGEYIFVE